MVASRQFPRIKIFEPAELLVGDTRRRVHVLNISSGGALLHCDMVPRQAETVQLALRGASWSARVAWTTKSRFGVQFVVPLTDIQLGHVTANT